MTFTRTCARGKFRVVGILKGFEVLRLLIWKATIQLPKLIKSQGRICACAYTKMLKLGHICYTAITNFNFTSNALLPHFIRQVEKQ